MQEGYPSEDQDPLNIAAARFYMMGVSTNGSTSLKSHIYIHILSVMIWLMYPLIIYIYTMVGFSGKNMPLTYRGNWAELGVPPILKRKPRLRFPPLGTRFSQAVTHWNIGWSCYRCAQQNKRTTKTREQRKVYWTFRIPAKTWCCDVLF